MALRKLSRQLLNKSENAFLLALEIYNKSTVEYRLESFCILFINAWELLLKAKIIEDTKNSKSIFIKGTRLKETITFTEALGRVITDKNSPVRKNLEDINELRNTSSHLIIPEYETIYAGLFQQGVLNYVSFLKSWFSRDIKVTPRLLTIAFEYQPSVIKKITIEDKYNKMLSTAFLERRDSILKNIKENPEGYSIPIDSKLALVKNPKKADITLTVGDNASKEALLVEVAKDHDKTHPYLLGATKNPKPDTVLYILRNKGYEVNSYDMQAINFAENINEKTRPDFVYKSKVVNSSPQYSQKYIDYIAKKLASNPNFKKISREKYKNYREKNKKSK